MDDDLEGFSFANFGQDYDEEDLYCDFPQTIRDDPPSEHDYFNDSQTGSYHSESAKENVSPFDGSMDTRAKAKKKKCQPSEERVKLTDCRKKYTEKFRKLIQDNNLLTITQPIRGWKPGALSINITKMRQRPSVLKHFGRHVENHLPHKLKPAEKKALKKARSQHSEFDELFETKTRCRIPVAPPCFYDVFKVRPPALDLTTVTGLTVDDLERTDLVVAAREFLEVHSTVQKLHFIRDLARTSRKELVHSITSGVDDEPHLFVEPKEDETDTCARIRPLIKAAKRILVNIPDPETRRTPKFTLRGNTVQDYAACDRDISGDFTIASDISPESIMTMIMHRRAFDHTNSLTDRIDALAEGIKYEKVHMAEVETSESGLIKPHFKSFQESAPVALPNDMKLVLKKSRFAASENSHYEVVRQEALPPVQIKPNTTKRPTGKSSKKSVPKASSNNVKLVPKLIGSKNSQYDAVRNQALPPLQIKPKPTKTTGRWNANIMKKYTNRR